MTQDNFKKKIGVVNVRLDPDLKDDVENILNNLGLNLSEVVRDFLEQIVITQGLPIECSFHKKIDGKVVLKSTLLEDIPRSDKGLPKDDI